MINVLFAAAPARWAQYEAPLRAAFDAKGLNINLSSDMLAETVDYIIYAPNGPLQDFSAFPQAKAVLSLWAGVEQVVGNETLTQPLCRMVDTGLEEGMVEWVTGHVLRHHLGMDQYIVNPTHAWAPNVPPLARDRNVCVLGLGALGQACASALSDLRFNISGWSRSAKNIDGVRCYHGDDGLKAALAQAEILVLLLPLTDSTQNILNADTLAQLPAGAALLNPGRGALIDDPALQNALTSGQVSHATLDVFRQEPLPADHPYWTHPNVTVTPHVASETRPSSAAAVIAENIWRSEAGEPLKFLVDRDLGY